MRSLFSIPGGMNSFQCFALHGRTTCAYTNLHTFITFPFSLSYPGMESGSYFSLVGWFPRRKKVDLEIQERGEERQWRGTYIVLNDRSKEENCSPFRQAKGEFDSLLSLWISVCLFVLFESMCRSRDVTMSAFRLFRRSGAIGSRVCSVLPLSSCVFVIPACCVCMNSSISYDTGSRVECLLLLRNLSLSACESDVTTFLPLGDSSVPEQFTSW